MKHEGGNVGFPWLCLDIISLYRGNVERILLEGFEVREVLRTPEKQEWATKACESGEYEGEKIKLSLIV